VNVDPFFFKPSQGMIWGGEKCMLLFCREGGRKHAEENCAAVLLIMTMHASAAQWHPAY
jgi:hypothetical protein